MSECSDGSIINLDRQLVLILYDNANNLRNHDHNILPDAIEYRSPLVPETSLERDNNVGSVHVYKIDPICYANSAVLHGVAEPGAYLYAVGG